MDILLVSARGAPFTGQLFDYESGNTLHLYKNGSTAASDTLHLLGDSYLVSAQEDKPLVNLWPINSQEPVRKLGTVLPEKINVLEISPDNSYLAAGIGAKLYVWHLSSGRLFTVQKRHFQALSKLRFSQDGGFLVVGGMDGQVIAYNFLNLISFNENYLGQSELGTVEPHFAKRDHNMPITDLHLGIFSGTKSRLVTVSSDNTAKIYSLGTGELLLSLVFDHALTACVTDAPFWCLYVGMATGGIQQFVLKEPPRTLESHVNSDVLTFQGHSKRVHCLALNACNSKMASGGEDGVIFIWELRSRQILKRLELGGGGITNVKFVPKLKSFFSTEFKPKIVVKNLQRELSKDELFCESKIQDEDLVVGNDDTFLIGGETLLEKLEGENSKLKVINRQIYEAAVEISRKYNNF